MRAGWIPATLPGRTGCELWIYFYPGPEREGRDPREKCGTPHTNPLHMRALILIARKMRAEPGIQARKTIFCEDSNHKRYINRFTNTTTYSVQSEYRAL